MKTIVLHHQSLLDLSIQHTGAVENAFVLAVENGLSLTDELTSGESLSLATYDIQQNKDILGYYQAKRLQPATAISQTLTANSRPQGIDYWAIGTEFIIS